MINYPIQIPSTWRFFGIRYPDSGRQPLDDWFRELSDEARFALIAALKDAQKIENPVDWLCFKRYLQGKYKKYRIWEIWFSCSDNREYRLLGIFGPVRKQAIFLIGCYHKARVYTPADALDSAFRRARDLADGKVTTYERKIPTDR